MYGIFSYIYHKNQPNVGIYIYIFIYHTRILWVIEIDLFLKVSSVNTLNCVFFKQSIPFFKPRNWMIALISFVSIIPYQAMPTWRKTSIGCNHRRKFEKVEWASLGLWTLGIYMYFDVRDLFAVYMYMCMYVYIYIYIWFTTYFIVDLYLHTHTC